MTTPTGHATGRDTMPPSERAAQEWAEQASTGQLRSYLEFTATVDLLEELSAGAREGL